jgi:hypothetical protein
MNMPHTIEIVGDLMTVLDEDGKVARHYRQDRKS